MRTYILPDGKQTKDADTYGNAWTAIGKRLEKIFDGYVLASCNPGFRLELRKMVDKRTYDVVDFVVLSVEAANLLLNKFEREK